MTIQNPKKIDLTIIGTGMAGMAAALFAVNRGLSVAQVGRSSEIGLASGFFDLLGVHPIQAGRPWDNPWEGIDVLSGDIPKHPYAKIPKEDIHKAFEELLQFLEKAGLPYYHEGDRNIRMVTPLGTIKTTYCVPRTMQEGVRALEQRLPCLFVDFKGLKGFSAGLMTGNLKERWPGLRSIRIAFPGMEDREEVLLEHLAHSLILKTNLAGLAQRLKPEIKDAQCVGLPAVLGLYQSEKVTTDLTAMVGVPVFEIPTLPPSLPGLRLKEAFERGLEGKRFGYYSQHKILALRQGTDGFEIEAEGLSGRVRFRSKGVLLASGRFFGGGLTADRRSIRETVFNLPVFQPEERKDWHQADFFDPQGHAINQAGLEIDHYFRPVDNEGRPVFETVFAAGSILAHQDWKRQKCGTGLSVATAFEAVKGFQKVLIDQ